MMRKKTALLLTIFFMFFAACGDDDDNGEGNGDDTPSTLTLEETSKELSDSVCAKIFSCCKNGITPLFASYIGATETECKTKLAQTAGVNEYDEQKSEWNESNASKCVSQLKKVLSETACDTTVDPDTLIESESCENTVTGKLAEGATCDPDYEFPQCTGDLECDDFTEKCAQPTEENDDNGEDDDTTPMSLNSLCAPES